MATKGQLKSLLISEQVQAGMHAEYEAKEKGEHSRRLPRPAETPQEIKRLAAATDLSICTSPSRA